VRVGVDNTGSFGFDFGSVGGALIHAETNLPCHLPAYMLFSLTGERVSFSMRIP
jgi:hypothetical protein